MEHSPITSVSACGFATVSRPPPSELGLSHIYSSVLGKSPNGETMPQASRFQLCVQMIS